MSKHFDSWQKATREEAAAKGISFRPGTSLQHVLVGKVEDSSTSFATAVYMHFLNPSNPEIHKAFFNFFKLLFKVANELQDRKDGDLLSSCARMMPRAASVMKDVIQDAKYRVTDAGEGHFRHCFTCRWNLKAIRKRFGEDQLLGHVETIEHTVYSITYVCNTVYTYKRIMSLTIFNGFDVLGIISSATDPCLIGGWNQPRSLTSWP